MKRDMELCRKILLQIEESGEPFEVSVNTDICGYSEREIGFHTRLLEQAGLIEATDGWVTMNRPWAYYPIDITWEGYEFLDAARNESIWKATLEKLNSEGVSFTFDLLKSTLAKVLEETIFPSG